MKSATMDLSKTYQKKTDREHILDAPDTYIGSIEKDDFVNWTYDEATQKMVHKKYSMVPGLYKCFDEGIVNARDHYIRMKEKCKKDKTAKPVSYIDIGIDKETGVITMINDGNGIDVAEHPEHKLWIPEMIFGHLRTSTNYKKDEKKIVGGKNGFGFKLVLIYSKWGSVETVDHVRGLKYKQSFKDNLSVIEKPKITKCSKAKPYTKVTWLPDYERFGLSGITDDIYAMFQKRTYDISAVTDKTLKVKLNSNVVPIKHFEGYVDMYIGGKSETKRIYEKANDRWEYAVCLTPNDEFTQVSFVNGIYTKNGGKHVDYVLNQITKKLVEFIEKKKKVKVKASSIKEQLMLFVNCVVENPSFDSQTKDTMNTNVSKFGSTCKVSDKFIEKVAKLGIMDQAISIHNVKENKDSKKTDGKKTKSVRGIPKLIDANWAGTAKSHETMLILCEGDSAKAGVVSGLSKEDRNVIGIYPLKGKLMNIRDASVTKINSNNEISEMKKILGLEANKKYKSKEDIQKSLRYGKILFLTDQDVDGSHIKGLCINLFESQWNDLVKADNFLGFMNTPILKAKKGNQEISFYNEKEYDDWKKENNDGKGWKVKYYKGLGTSTAKEFKEYFAKKKIVEFKYGEKTDSESLDMVFNKSRADDRKEWLENYNKDATLDTSKPQISYQDFVNKELIHFSKYDCERSIPNLMDGLKTSQRKILYSAFKRNLTSEIKVAQFGGYVSEHSGYHHGEMSLMQAIVGMAQDFVGSNNINLLMPNGQFGTRLQGGSDSASERYIFTQLNVMTKTIYREEDKHVLNYLDDDGYSIEPEFYVPTIPMILVNGAIGIGTGFSTSIMCYNPDHIIQYIESKLTKDGSVSHTAIHPYYEGFTGKIQKIDDVTYMFKGVYEVIADDKIHITELPIGTWTQKYKEFLEKMMSDEPKDKDKDKKGGKSSKKKQLVKDYKDNSTDTKVDFTVTFQKGELKKLLAKVDDNDVNEMEKSMNLTTTKKTTNMHMFNEKQKLMKFKSAEEIVDYFMPIRIQYYTKRKEDNLEKLEYQVKLLSNKAKFIQEQLDDSLDLRRKSKAQIVELLKSKKYDELDEDFKYLRSMPIDSVMSENIEKLLNEKAEREKEYDVLMSTTESQMWLNELQELKNKYKIHKLNAERKQEGKTASKKVKKTKKTLKLKA